MRKIFFMWMASLLGLFVFSSLAQAQDFEISAGASQSHHQWTPTLAVEWNHPIQTQWKGAQLSWVWGNQYFSSVNRFRSLDLWNAGLRFTRPPWFFEESLAFDFTHHNKSISNNTSFSTSLGLKWHRLFWMIRHISNAGLKEPNRGETMILVGVSWK